jgi:Holliday junction resolvasome RuvABC endonuclease subunit
VTTVVGIDYSLTCPCVCVARDTDFHNSFFYYLTDKKSAVGKFKNIFGDEHDDYLIDQQRYENNASWVMSIVGDLEPDTHIMIEDYSFGSKGRVFNLAENCGIMKYLLYKGNYNFHTVAPTVVKKFATGKGNANKEAMYDAFIKETQFDLIKILTPKSKQVGNPVSDIVDAWYLAKYMLSKLEY